MEESKIAIKLEEETKPIKKMCEKLMDAVNHELDKGIENVNAEELGEVIDMIKDLYEAKEKMVKSCYYKQIMEAMEESEYGEDYDEDGPMDDGRRGYRGQARDSRGRYMGRRGRGGRRGYENSMYDMMPDMYRQMPIEWDRDMDREGMGKMYYSGSGASGSGMSGQSSGSSGMSGGSSGGNMGSSSDSGMRGYSDGNSNGGNRESGRDSREGRSGRSRRGYMEAKEQGKEKGEKMKELENYMKSLAEDVTEMVEGASAEEKTMLKTKLSTLISKVS